MGCLGCCEVIGERAGEELVPRVESRGIAPRSIRIRIPVSEFPFVCVSFYRWMDVPWLSSVHPVKDVLCWVVIIADGDGDVTCTGVSPPIDSSVLVMAVSFFGSGFTV